MFFLTLCYRMHGHYYNPNNIYKQDQTRKQKPNKIVGIK
jgi:hypothetical protein